MANEKILDITKSAAANETAVNNKFEELSSQSTPSTIGSSVNIRGTIEQLDVTWQGGYIIANGTAELSAASSWKVTDLFTVSNEAGKYLFIPGYFDKKFANTNDDWFMYSKFNSNSTLELVQTFNEWNRPYLIIPIKTDAESYRICMKKAYTNYGAVYLVDRDWLVSAGYADAWAGKKWIMYGDSYVGGYPNGYTWHHTFAKKHYVNYIQNGYNGRGLVISAGENNDTLLTLLESTMLDNSQPLDVDIIGLTFGRNDYSKNVPIGNIDDMIENIPANALNLTDYCAKSPGQAGYDEELANVTFMGGLNYLCNWLANNYPTKKVFFITPWYFINDYNHTVNTPVEYIDAVKAIAGKWGFPCFDAARQSGIHVQNVKFREDYFNESGSADTSHLKPNGHLLMAAGPVAAWLENLFRE